MRFRRSVIITPWLRLFRAELMNAFLCNFACLTIRRAECNHRTTATRKELTTTTTISISHKTLGSIDPTYVEGDNAAGIDQAASNGTTAHATACARIEILPPARQYLPTIIHPRISGSNSLASRVWIG